MSEEAAKVEVVTQQSTAPLFDPVEVERKMVEEELRKQQEADPVEIASMLLTLYTPRFCALVDKLSNRQLRRLVKGLVQHPTGKQYDATDELEAEAAAIGRNLIDSNVVLVMDTYREHGEEIARKASEQPLASSPIEVHYGEIPQEENGNE